MDDSLYTRSCTEGKGIKIKGAFTWKWKSWKTSKINITEKPTKKAKQWLYQKKDIEIEVHDTDIRVDVYRSSGKGGQGVNTTDSAVRITHLETGIVVTCQNERSQIRNKEIALDVLKNKLYQRQLEERQKELSSIKGDNADINFGSQIRTYTMHPYSLVKDHRTNTETGNVEKVLDGDIEMFINDYLKRVKSYE